MDIGGWIAEIRKHRELTQGDLAYIIDISQKHLNEIERGKKKPRWELLEKILCVLKVEIELKIL